MTFSKLVFAMFYSACLMTLPALANQEAKSITTDYRVSDYGQFIRDNTNFNGIFRVTDLNGTVTAQVLMVVPNSNIYSKAKPEEIVTAELKLELSGENEYKITDVAIKNENYAQSLIYKINGIIRFEVPGDFGALQMRVKSSVDAKGYNEVSYEKVIQGSEGH